MSERRPYALIYDAACELCEGVDWWVKRLDKKGLIQPVALQDPTAQKLLGPRPGFPGLRREEIQKSFHFIFPDGRIASADRAIPAVLEVLVWGRPLAWLIRIFPGAKRVTAWVYGWVARNRHRWQHRENEWTKALKSE